MIKLGLISSIGGIAWALGAGDPFGAAGFGLFASVLTLALLYRPRVRRCPHCGPMMPCRACVEAHLAKRGAGR